MARAKACSWLCRHRGIPRIPPHACGHSHEQSNSSSSGSSSSSTSGAGGGGGGGTRSSVLGKKKRKPSASLVIVQAPTSAAQPVLASQALVLQDHAELCCHPGLVRASPAASEHGSEKYN